MNQQNNEKPGFWDDRVSKETSEGIRFIVGLLASGISLGIWVRTNYNIIWLAIFIVSFSYLVILVIQNRNSTSNNGVEG